MTTKVESIEAPTTEELDLKVNSFPRDLWCEVRSIQYETITTHSSTICDFDIIHHSLKHIAHIVYVEQPKGDN
jgi:hypothetical protein